MSIDIRETFWDFCNSYSGLRLSFPNSSKANVLALRELDVLQRDFPDVHLVRGNVALRFPILAACSTAPAVGAAVSKFLHRTRTFMLFKTCLMANCAKFAFFPRVLMPLFTALFIRPRIMTRARRNDIRCCICNTVPAKMKLAGAIKDTPVGLWIT